MLCSPLESTQILPSCRLKHARLNYANHPKPASRANSSAERTVLTEVHQPGLLRRTSIGCPHRQSYGEGKALTHETCAPTDAARLEDTALKLGSTQRGDREKQAVPPPLNPARNPQNKCSRAPSGHMLGEGGPRCAAALDMPAVAELRPLDERGV